MAAGLVDVAADEGFSGVLAFDSSGRLTTPTKRSSIFTRLPGLVTVQGRSLQAQAIAVRTVGRLRLAVRLDWTWMGIAYAPHAAKTAATEETR